MTNAQYLLFTPHGYYLRVKVPKDLREQIGKSEIKKSLATFDRSHAIKVAGYLMFEIERVFTVMRGSDLSKRYKLNLPILLGLNASTLRARMRKYGIVRQ